MEHQKLTLRGCLGLIVFTLSLLLGFWLVVKFDMCPFRVTGEGDRLGNRPTIDSNPDMEFWEHTARQRSAMSETKCPDSFCRGIFQVATITQADVDRTNHQYRIGSSNFSRKSGS